MVRAKFKVDSIKRSQTYRYDDTTKFTNTIVLSTIEMLPVYPGPDKEHENTKFWNATPRGKLELGCVEEKAASEFELGQEYYLDFSKAS